MNRLARAAAKVALLILIVGLSGLTYAAHAEQASRGQFEPPGQLLDIGDRQLIHLRTWGVRAPNEPAIILDASAGMPSSEWAWVGPMLAEAGHYLVAYDRPGLAWSAGPDRPRDALSAARALELALVDAGIDAPFVVVGHSFGGFSARAFAGTYPEQVKGLVLLDTTDPDGRGGPGFALHYRLMAWQAALGLYALSAPTTDFRELPPADQEPAAAISRWPSFLDTAARELELWDVSAAQIRPLDLSNIPLLVVCSPASPTHVSQQQHIAALSNHSTYVELGVSHMGMLLSRDQAALTARSIEDFVDSL